MFSLSDLNQKFVKFTANISNLDNMQADGPSSTSKASTEDESTFT
jgi:hypothetical protein